MKHYSCSVCANTIYFENSLCLSCQNPLGFDPSQLSMLTLKHHTNAIYQNRAENGLTYRYCKNSQEGNCNWLIKADSPNAYCIACELNRTIPPLTKPEYKKKWTKIEMSKHRLIYSLLRFNLPVNKKTNNSENGIAFDFMVDTSWKKKVFTGHNNGIITINIDEADETELSKNKSFLGEKYRTLLGHFRHEIGHYYWTLLIKNTPLIHKYRQLFGDERQDYEGSLKRYYYSNRPVNWSNQYISMYATSHSWEDWAETWAHYMHMMDTLETAYSLGFQLQPQFSSTSTMHVAVLTDPYTIQNFNQIFTMWKSLSLAMNSLNRSMGHTDFYPFIISPIVVEKLTFIHEVASVHCIK